MREAINVRPLFLASDGAILLLAGAFSALSTNGVGVHMLEKLIAVSIGCIVVMFARRDQMFLVNHGFEFDPILMKRFWWIPFLFFSMLLFFLKTLSSIEQNLPKFLPAGIFLEVAIFSGIGRLCSQYYCSTVAKAKTD